LFTQETAVLPRVKTSSIRIIFLAFSIVRSTCNESYNVSILGLSAASLKLLDLGTTVLLFNNSIISIPNPISINCSAMILAGHMACGFNGALLGIGIKVAFSKFVLIVAYLGLDIICCLNLSIYLLSPALNLSQIP